MKNWKIDRRRFLRGVGLTGIAIALPPLEAMFDSRGRMHGAVSAQPPTPPSRMVLFHLPNGVQHDHWTPSAGGAGLAAPAAMSSLGTLTSEVNVLSGLSNAAAVSLPGGVTIDAHQAAGSSILTGVPSLQGGAGGVSVDQLAAQHIGGTTKFRSLVVYASSENSVHHSRMSWRGANDPVEPIQDPQALFNQLFSDAGMDDGAARRLAEQRQSILDFVKDDVDDLQRVLGSDDRARLTQHLDSIADLERTLQGGGGGAACTTPQDPGPYPLRRDANFMATYEQRVDVMIELVRLALACDLTRVVSFSLGSTNNTNIYPFMTSPLPDHEVSHYGLPGGTNRSASDPGAISRYLTMSEWKIGRAAQLIAGLRDTDDGTGRLLDNVAFAAFSEMANGDWHSTFNLPVITAGKLGSMTTGQHLEFPCDNAAFPTNFRPDQGHCSPSGNNTSISALWLTMLQAVGAPVTSFGDATRTLSGLWGT